MLKNLLNTFLQLGISFSKTKSKNARRESVLNKREIEHFKMKSKTVDYNFLRSSPKIENIVEACSAYELNRSEYPFIEEPKNLPRVRAKTNIKSNAFGGDDGEDSSKPYLIVFSLGGIAHNEICALERLTQENNEKRVYHNLVIGSTSIITAEDYIDNLKDMSAPKDVTSSNFVADPKSLEMTDIELTVKK